MPKIYGLVNYNINKPIAEDLRRFTYNISSSIKSKSVLFHYNPQGVFIELTEEREITVPHSIIYKNIKYTFIFDGSLDNSNELFSSISEELGFAPTDKENHGALAVWAYILWGGFSPQRLYGKFVYAIYSEPIFYNNTYSPRVFIARDRLGIIPLYFSYINNSIVFSSSASRILKDKRASPKLDKLGLWQILFLNGYTVEGNTVYKDIFELQPGCCAYIDCRHDGSRTLMQKRYLILKNPKFNIDPYITKEPLSNDFNFIEETAFVPDNISLEDLDSCIEICEAPYFSLNYNKFKTLSGTKNKNRIFSNIGADSFDFSEKNYIKSFFPWIRDPYENTEPLKSGIIYPEEGFNWLSNVFLQAKAGFEFDEDENTQMKRIRMCLYYFYNLPNKLKYHEKIANFFSLKINYPYADYNLFEKYYYNLENISENNKEVINVKIKNSEFDNLLKSKLKEIISNPEFRINYLLNADKVLTLLETCENTKQIEFIYILHAWLEKFNVEFDF